MLNVIEANYKNNYKLTIKFNDEKEDEVDLQDFILEGKIKPFKKLADLNEFKNFSVDYTIKWGEDLELAPEYLYFKAFEKDEKLQETFREWGYI